MLLASSFTKNELLHTYFSWILISNLGTPISRNTSEWLLLFAKLLKRKRSTLSTARFFIEYTLILIVDKGHFDGVNFFLNADTFVKRTFFVNGLFSKCRSYENFVEIKNLKCQGIMLIIIQLRNLMACFLFLFLSFFIFLFIIFK